MKKRYKFLIGFLIIFTVISILPFLFQDSDQLGKFRTVEGEDKYKEAYANAMKLLPEPNRTLDIETDYGVVRVYEFINSSNKLEIPIVLLPGRTSGTPMWAENLGELLSQRTIYTIDILGDAGMSVQNKPIENAYDQALWLEQVFKGIELSQLHLIGHSFGGWNAANYTVHYPDRVISLSLLEPVFVFTGLRWDFYIKSIPASLPFLPDSMREKMLADIGGTAEVDMNDPLARMIAEATEHYAVALPLPKVIGAEQLSKLNMPIYVALGGKSVLHDSQKAYDNALQSVKNLEVKIWEDGTHSLPMEYTEEISQELLQFMRNIDD
ncbi:MAG: alpha/beta hydrolase [Tissierella sp.]|nr:alpha/beta hydrolase [Tissierella sp.]